MNTNHQTDGRGNSRHATTTAMVSDVVLGSGATRTGRPTNQPTDKRCSLTKVHWSTVFGGPASSIRPNPLECAAAAATDSISASIRRTVAAQADAPDETRSASLRHRCRRPFAVGNSTRLAAAVKQTEISGGRFGHLASGRIQPGWPCANEIPTTFRPVRCD